jgi:hypothetical protein
MRDADGLWPGNVDPFYEIPSVVFKDDIPESIPVSIVVEKTKKPFLGGYRDPTTGARFHHAECQTDESALLDHFKRFVLRDRSHLCVRATQTQELRPRATQGPRDCGSQCERPHLSPSAEKDKFIFPRAYEDSTAWSERRSSCATTIQKLWRGALGRLRAENMRRQRSVEQETKDQEERFRQKLEADRREWERQRRTDPRTRGDFEVVRTEMIEEAAAGVQRVIQNVDDPFERTTSLLQISLRQAESLARLEQLRGIVTRDAQAERLKTNLERQACPLHWRLTGQLAGDVCEVSTPMSMRAARLIAAYTGLEAPCGSSEERATVLRDVEAVVEAGSVVTETGKEVTRLVRRELDLLSRGRSARLSPLRLRLLHLFAAYVEDPATNPACGLTLSRRTLINE